MLNPVFNNYKMKDELFKQKLSEVAEWHMPKITLDGVERRKLKGKDDQFYEQHREEFLKRVNYVLPGTQPVITKLLDQNKTCEDCGLQPKKPREVLIKVSEGCGLDKHLRRKCKSCDLWQDPRTGQYTVKTNNISNVWISWATEQGLIKTKQHKTSTKTSDCQDED